MFCHISQNWRGPTLLSQEVVVNLIVNTTTVGELKIQAKLDENICEAGIKVSDQELAEVTIKRDAFMVYGITKLCQEHYVINTKCSSYFC